MKFRTVNNHIPVGAPSYSKRIDGEQDHAIVEVEEGFPGLTYGGFTYRAGDRLLVDTWALDTVRYPEGTWRFVDASDIKAVVK